MQLQEKGQNDSGKEFIQKKKILTKHSDQKLQHTETKLHSLS